uniref:Uncharacterized protein n=1 Tax=Bracon brevicornis TaxID=1563983 RepID=A0A6V7M158_9HYME
MVVRVFCVPLSFSSCPCLARESCFVNLPLFEGGLPLAVLACGLAGIPAGRVNTLPTRLCPELPGSRVVSSDSVSMGVGSTPDSAAPASAVSRLAAGWATEGVTPAPFGAVPPPSADSTLAVSLATAPPSLLTGL